MVIFWASESVGKQAKRRKLLITGIILKEHHLWQLQRSGYKCKGNSVMVAVSLKDINEHHSVK